MSYLVPLLRYTKEMPYPYNVLGKMMNRIYGQMIDKKNSDEIQESLSKSEKKLVVEMQVKWRTDLLWVETPKGLLAPNYLPDVNHIVLYGILGKKSKSNMSSTIYTTALEKVAYSSLENFYKQLQVTEKGTEILSLDKDFDIATISTGLDEDQRTQLICYIVLRLLVDKNKDFIKQAIELSSKNDYRINSWLAKLLKSSIITPSFPDLQSIIEKNGEFSKILSKWYNENIGKIEITNDFLFEKPIELKKY